MSRLGVQLIDEARFAQFEGDDYVISYGRYFDMNLKTFREFLDIRFEDRNLRLDTRKMTIAEISNQINSFLGRSNYELQR